MPIVGGFNTQPPEGGCENYKDLRKRVIVSTHSRPKAAAGKTAMVVDMILFQHTAARRRLTNVSDSVRYVGVSTHSRPKAAGQCRN